MLSRYPFRQTIDGTSFPSSNRPLSDIREITEPSLVDGSARNPPAGTPHLTTVKRVAQPDSSAEEIFQSPHPTHEAQEDGCSNHEIFFDSVPPRSSSRARKEHVINGYGHPVLSEPRGKNKTVGNEYVTPMQTSSLNEAIPPVAESFMQDDQSCRYHCRKTRSKTLVRLPNRTSDDILDHPMLLHPRIRIDLQAAAPLFVGGSTVEGVLRVLTDEADRVRYRKTLSIQRASVDVLGVEEMTSDKRHVFLALSTEIIDFMHPPPPGMAESTNETFPRDRSWILIPSVAVLPFIITLPLEIGPPTFTSKHARIKYLLSATLLVKDSGRQLSVRCTQPTFILSVYDPETALASLPTPLTATDEYTSRSRPGERIIVTAGLHRKVWVSGTTIFADVHVVNNSRKAIRKIELQLERAIFCRRNAPASSPSDQPPKFGQLERSVICKGILRYGQQGWSGVEAYSTCLRTCDLELPRGHTSVQCNKYFEVRFYLIVAVSTTHHKIAVVQLPISLIHMNSLDVPTNSVEQVAAAIDEIRQPGDFKSRGKLPRHPDRIGENAKLGFEGRAFSAPRARSLENRRAREDDLEQLTKELEASPRKSPRHVNKAVDTKSTFNFRSPPANRRGRIFLGDEAEALRRQFNGGRHSFSPIIDWQPPSFLPITSATQQCLDASAVS